VNCTLTRNTGAEGGGGVYCWDATAHTILVNSIVADNTPNSVCGKVASCLIGEDPLFIDPSDGDYRLAPSSPCIDAGICEVAPAFDIEGHPRPAGAGCDIGAYEFAGPGAPEYLRGDADADGDLTISDPIASLNYQFASSPPPTCLKTADINDDGRIDLADPVFELAYLFADGPAPPPPLRECGADPTADGLSCRSYGPCK